MQPAKNAYWEPRRYTPQIRPRQREVLIEVLRKGKIDEAVRAFKKIYLEVVHQIIDHLETAESANSAH